MPTFAPHLAAGLATSLPLTAVLGVPLTPAVAAIAAIGSVAPDLDHPHSTPTQTLHKGLFVASGVLVFDKTLAKNPLSLEATLYFLGIWLIVVLAGAGLLWLLRRTVLPHRGPTHHPLAVPLYALIVLSVTGNWGTAAIGATAYASHLLLDRVF